MLVALGTAAGLAAARWTLHGLVRYLAALPIAIPHLQGVALNGRVLAANAALCVVLACALSLLPVLLARRADLQTALRTGQGGGTPEGLDADVFNTHRHGGGVCVPAAWWAPA